MLFGFFFFFETKYILSGDVALRVSNTIIFKLRKLICFSKRSNPLLLHDDLSLLIVDHVLYIVACTFIDLNTRRKSLESEITLIYLP